MENIEKITTELGHSFVSTEESLELLAEFQQSGFGDMYQWLGQILAECFDDD